MKLSNLLIVSVMFVAAALLTGCVSSNGLFDAPGGIVQKGHDIFENPIYVPFTHETKFVSSTDRIIMVNNCPPNYTVTVYKESELVVDQMDQRPYKFYPDSPFRGDPIVLTVKISSPDGSKNMSYTYMTRVNSMYNGPVTESLVITPNGCSPSDQYRENYF